jgi:hypothetical protein
VPALIRHVDGRGGPAWKAAPANLAVFRLITRGLSNAESGAANDVTPESPATAEAPFRRMSARPFLPSFAGNQRSGAERVPGPYVHISSMWHVAEQFANGDYTPVESARINPAWAGDDVGDLGALMDEFPNFAAIGAVGPDLFFFLPDFRDYKGIPTASVLIGVLGFLEQVYEAIDPYISKWEHYLGPISEDTAEELSRLAGGLDISVANITGELGGIVTTLLEDLAVQQQDWWEKFSLGLDVGYDDQAYLWSDMLHYRATGQFGQTLWENAKKGGARQNRQRAYALGYITHLATDVTAHAYVNAISGGPFRTHWQRHHLVENHIDAYWYLLDTAQRAPRTMVAGYEQWTNSALYYDIGFDEHEDDGPLVRPALPSGHTLRENWERKRLLDKDSKLPDDVAHLEGLPSAELIKEAYDVFWRYLRFSSTDGLAHDPPPPPDLFPNLDPPTIHDPGDTPDENDGDFWKDLLDVILAIVSVILFIVEVAVWLATVLPAALADIATYPVRLTLYYALELPLYYMLKAFRMVLVMTGYLHPNADEIAQSLVRIGNPTTSTWQQTIDELGDTFGGMLPERPAGDESGDPFVDEAYPHQHEKRDAKDGMPGEFRHPWDYPTTPVELSPTTSGPAARNAGPTSIFVEVPPDAEIRDELECATTPDAADTTGKKVTPTRHMGDSVSFSKYLIWLASRTALPGHDDGLSDGDLTHVDTHGRLPHGCAPGLVDWNLDSDRGYGYHCWDWNRDPRAVHDDPTDHTFQHQDPNMHWYHDPCTWPPQAGPDSEPATPSPDPSKTLQLHWADRPDPGCTAEPAPPME